MSYESLDWVKSSFSFNSGECVELARRPDGSVALRDSKNPLGGALTFTRGEFDAFCKGVAAGEFEDFR